ncbi:MAG: tetratricopeptide repeat protein, partial [Thaumarchaeota archaeon]|nr:tetratricopeptide repeat protein [Nitrososphaerota archaeon]
AKHLLDKQRSIIRRALSAHGGRDVGGNLATGEETGLKGWLTGVGVKIPEMKLQSQESLVLFESAPNATRCAVEIQRTLSEYNREAPNYKDIYLKIGVHIGKVAIREGEVSGEAVAVASKVAPFAEAGGICVTEQAYRQVENNSEFPCTKLGVQSLKNIASPVVIYKVNLSGEREVSVETPSLDRRRIAVLPLSNFSPEKSDEYFADGLTEELISTLSLIEEFRVISRTSVMQYKEVKKSVVEIGKELNVGSVLEGSVRKAGNRIRVTVQLIDAQNGEHLWASSYDRQLDDIFAIQTDVAGKIVGALRVKLMSGQVPVQKHGENVEAYTLYLNGRFLLDNGSEEAVLEALKLLQEAIKTYPDYARAYSTLADAYSIAADRGFMDRVEGYSKAKEALTKALELDDTIVEAHASLGVNLLSRLNDAGKMEVEEAQKEFRRAIELSPSYATAHQWYSLCLLEMGKINDAMDEIKRASELDPLSPIIALRIADLNALAGRIEEAIAICDKLIGAEPNFAFAYAERSFFLTLVNMKERSLADSEAYQNLSGDEEGYKLALAQTYAWFGEKGKALPIVQEAIMKADRSSGDLLQFIARVYAILGEKDEFFAWIDRAVAKKRISVVLLRYSPFYGKVRNDPRFPELFRSLGLPY